MTPQQIKQLAQKLQKAVANETANRTYKVGEAVVVLKDPFTQTKSRVGIVKAIEKDGRYKVQLCTSKNEDYNSRVQTTGAPIQIDGSYSRLTTTFVYCTAKEIKPLSTRKNV